MQNYAVCLIQIFQTVFVKIFIYNLSLINKMLEALMLLSAVVVVYGWQVCLLPVYPCSTLRALQQLQTCKFYIVLSYVFF